MIVVDSSALCAVFFKEPEKDAFQALIDGDDRCVISAVNAHETAFVLRGKLGDAAVAQFWEWLVGNRIEIVPFDEIQARAASDAYGRFGKGINSKASLTCRIAPLMRSQRRSAPHCCLKETTSRKPTFSRLVSSSYVTRSHNLPKGPRMLFPAITAFYASLLALIYAGLTGWVVAGRVGKETLFGEGDNALMRRVRSHANFIEYVPIVLILSGLYEGAGGNPTLVRVLLVVLVVARILHPIGMFAAVNTPRQFACRGGGIILTLIVMLVFAIALLLRLV